MSVIAFADDLILQLFHFLAQRCHGCQVRMFLVIEEFLDRIEVILWVVRFRCLVECLARVRFAARPDKGLREVTGQDGEESDTDHHDEHGDQPACVGDRVVIAIPYRGHGHQGPPEGIACVHDIGIRGVRFGLQNKDAAEFQDNDGCHKDSQHRALRALANDELFHDPIIVAAQTPCCQPVAKKAEQPGKGEGQATDEGEIAVEGEKIVPSITRASKAGKKIEEKKEGVTPQNSVE